SAQTMNISITNVPLTLTGCFSNTDGDCRDASVSRLPVVLPNYTAPGEIAQSSTAGGLNRPYVASGSFDLNDLGSSGSSSSISSMPRLNAMIDRGDGNPLVITNLSFHRIAMDAGTS